MTKTISDRWHVIKGQEVYVEDGYILRGIGGSGLKVVPTYPYWYDEKQGFWTSVERVKVRTFRNGRYAMKFGLINQSKRIIH